MVSKDEISMDTAKVKAVVEWPSPRLFEKSKVSLDSLGITEDFSRDSHALQFL